MKRQDLVDQFELIVQQEIINYNNRITGVNSSLEFIKSELIEVSHKQANDRASALSRDKAIEASSKKNHEDILKLSTRLDSRINDIVAENKKKNEDINRNSKRLDDLEKQIESFQKDMLSIKAIVASVRDENEKIVIAIRDELDRHYHKACKNLSAMEDSILSRPSEALEVKEHLEKKIAEKDVMVTGIYENFDHFTKKTNYMEKKIEDLYNKLDRLKH